MRKLIGNLLVAKLLLLADSTVVLSGDVQMPGHMHDRRDAVRFTRFARYFILGRIPRIGEFSGLQRQTNSPIAAIVRRGHPEEPLLRVCHNGDPVAREIHRCAAFGESGGAGRCAKAEPATIIESDQQKKKWRFCEPNVPRK